MMNLFEIIQANFLFWAAAIAVNMGLGTLWYSPALFGKRWMKLTKTKLGKMETETIIGTVIVSILTATVLLMLLLHLRVNTVEDGVFAAFYIWLGFVATSMFNRVLYTKVSVELYMIDAGYYLASYILMAGLMSYGFTQMIA